MAGGNFSAGVLPARTKRTPSGCGSGHRGVCFYGAAFLLTAATPICGAQVFPSSAGNIAVETVAKDLNHPWALAFLPDGRFLVTERVGRMRIVASTGSLSAPIANVPQVFANDEAGLLDVALDHNYAQNSLIYFCYAEPEIGGARTALARARLSAGATPRLDDLKIIFREENASALGKCPQIRRFSDRAGWVVTAANEFADRCVTTPPRGPAARLNS
jgi:hypothetical protein